MKRMLSIVAILTMVVFWTGCVRTTTYVRERVDQQSKGNRGYLQGDIPPSVGEIETSRVRTITRIEIELPSYAGWTPPPKTEDKEIWGNRGIIGGKSSAKVDLYPDAPVPQKTHPRAERKYTK